MHKTKSCSELSLNLQKTMVTEGKGYVFKKSINIVVTSVRLTKLIDVLDDSLFMEYQQNMIKK